MADRTADQRRRGHGHDGHNPHDNNTEGNGLTGTSGGTYFVDDPTYIHLQGTLPAGTTDVRIR